MPDVPSSLNLLGSGFNEPVLSFSLFPVSLASACTKTSTDSFDVVSRGSDLNLTSDSEGKIGLSLVQ